MTITTADLLYLLPMLIVTGAAVWVMLLIGIRRSYTATAGFTVAGLLLATLSAAVMIGDVSEQVTPLLLVDQYSMFFTMVVCGLAMFITVLSYPYLASLDDQREEFYLLLLVATIGAIVMVSTNHFVGVILGLETLSMSLYGMVAYTVHSPTADKYPLEASVKYLVLSAVGSGLVLFGMALVYAQTGTLMFSSLVMLDASLGDGYSIIAFLLIFVGVAFKLSLAPFHLWTPDVYEGSPLPATAYLATIGKAAMFVILLRLVETSGVLAFESVITVISLIAVASMLVGNLLALLQTSLKRILAYSSIGHMGYLLVALVAGYFADSSINVEAVTFYLVAYVVMSLGAFGVATLISDSDGEKDDIIDYSGLFWRNPWLALIFTGMLLSLAGIPLTIGFIGKFYLFLSGVEASLWMLLAGLVIGSGIGLYYYLRIIYRMVLAPEEAVPYSIDGSRFAGSFGVLAILLILLLVLGVYPAPLMTLIADISATI